MHNSAARFAIVLLVMTIICTFVWQKFVYGSLYFCSDPMLDFLEPGNWVHIVNGQSVQVVNHIVIADSMSESDSIKVGWTVMRLWHLWYSFVAVSLLVSFVISQLRWLPKHRLQPINAKSM